MLKVLKGIEDLGIDVNVEHPSVFSYKHFYVIFCSFYELDEDKDGYICGKNLKRYFDGALPKRVISRILNGKGKPKASLVVEGDGGEKRHKKKAMDYGDFVWFLVAEIDKGSETAVGYWFRILDLDEDGILSLYELEYFYEEICQKMEIDNNGEKITLADITCQLIDMVRPKEIGKVTVSDMKKLKYDLRPIFFDAFINLYRFYEHENRASALHKQLAKFMALKLAAYNTNGGDSSSDNENGTDHDHGKTNQK
ncbi:Serine/threonine-protein phosphatase 2A regulatory subunit B'' subunit alpha, partial [Zancudomyces culisetae]